MLDRHGRPSDVFRVNGSHADLLVLDEVLGVGDAYFTHKSYERIRGMCDQQGTTLLLVTHDIYSATQICGESYGSTADGLLWTTTVRP
jgi:ABC-type nitrate/sulfonate/bicarbonate transport system ATPase subunit